MEGSLLVGGLVRNPLAVGQAVEILSRVNRVEDFVCLEGWMRPQQRWSGYRLEDLLRLAGPMAPFLEVASGDFVAVLSIADIWGTNILLADTQNGQRLTAETGGPWRLVAPGYACFYSVKRVDRLTVVEGREGEAAETIAMARLEQSRGAPLLSSGSDSGADLGPIDRAQRLRPTPRIGQRPRTGRRIGQHATGHQAPGLQAPLRLPSPQAARRVRRRCLGSRNPADYLEAGWSEVLPPARCVAPVQRWRSPLKRPWPRGSVFKCT